MTPAQFIARWKGRAHIARAGPQAHFGWENKKPGRDLKATLKQLTDYTPEMPGEEILRRFLALNLARAAQQKGEST